MTAALRSPQRSQAQPLYVDARTEVQHVSGWTMVEKQHFYLQKCCTTCTAYHSYRTSYLQLHTRADTSAADDSQANSAHRGKGLLVGTKRSGPQAGGLIWFFRFAIIWGIYWPLLQDLALRDRLRKVQPAGICWVSEPAHCDQSEVFPVLATSKRAGAQHRRTAC